MARGKRKRGTPTKGGKKDLRFRRNKVKTRNRSKKK